MHNLTTYISLRYVHSSQAVEHRITRLMQLKKKNTILKDKYKGEKKRINRQEKKKKKRKSQF